LKALIDSVIQKLTKERERAWRFFGTPNFRCLCWRTSGGLGYRGTVNTLVRFTHGKDPVFADTHALIFRMASRGSARRYTEWIIPVMGSNFERFAGRRRRLVVAEDLEPEGARRISGH